jgi:arylformamidase
MAGTGPIYREYDRAGLDAQYFLRGAVLDFQQHFDRWQASSAAARAALPGRLDIAYGAHPLERFDLFPADRTGDAAQAAPVLVFIHGGYWHSLDKDRFSFIAPPWVARGIAFVSLNYPLCPEVAFDDLVGAVRRGLAWISRHGFGLGIDPARIVVAGHSAGGHLTARLLAERPAGVVGACAVSGIYDLDPIRLCFLNDQVRLDEAAVARHSPIRLIPPAAPPLVLAVGADETPEFLRQQADFAAAWQAPERPVETVVLPGLHHFNAVDALADPDQPLFHAVASRFT